MPAKKHRQYKEELERCTYTIDYVEKSLNNALNKKEKIDSSVDYAKRHYNAESSQSYIDRMVNTLIQGSLELKIRNLVTARSKPYFARVDFREKESGKLEKLYIGKMSLSRDEDQQIIIVDWRAPISNLYYEGRLGESHYQCPDGQINGDLLLKRQFSINEGKLDEIFDIDITTNDEFLQSYLGASADNRLKEIVSTIQVEQNEIIRADMWTPLIVQGAAGSGKTTIALHRIAYLIYAFEKSFKPENFMIIAPNRLFLNYISEVLPELGVERVKQTTFEEFAMELLGKKFKIREANEKLTLFVNKDRSEEDKKVNELIRRTSELKTSIDFKEVMDDYVSLVEKTFIPKEDFTIGSKVIFTYEEINDLFLHSYSKWHLAWRINEIKKHLSNRLKAMKDSIISGIEEDCDKKLAFYKMAMPDSDKRQQLIIKTIDKKNETITNIEKLSKSAVNDYIGRISKLSPYEYYKDFINNEEIFREAIAGRIDPELMIFAREYTKKNLDEGFVEIEDIAPITYLKFKIHGMDEKIPVRHIVIDEAQDFSVFQLYVLKKIVKDSSFTILGDLCQGIHSYRGIRDWKEVQERVFDDRRSGFLTLEQSYRTTVEIMDAANKVITKVKDRNLVIAKPVIRHGDKVEIIRMESTSQLYSEIGENIRRLKNAGFSSVAVIGKTMDECKALFNMLKKYDETIHLITGKEKVYKGGIVIVPSYLSKGLEFDAVIISNGSSTEYQGSELDAKLLYVAMTRPLHKLYIYYLKDLSPLIEGI